MLPRPNENNACVIVCDLRERLDEQKSVFGTNVLVRNDSHTRSQIDRRHFSTLDHGLVNEQQDT